MRVEIIGAGRVGTAVGILLQRRGHEVVGVWSRTSAAADAAARRLAAPVVGLDSLPAADWLLIGTPDDVVEEIAHAISPSSAGTLVCHFAGSLGTDPLAPAAAAGARVAALHPVQACPSVDAAVARLPGCAWGVTCGGAAFAAATRLVEDVDGQVVVVPEDARPVWHAAAVTAANGIAAMVAAGEALLASLDLPRDVLMPLAAGAVANAHDGGGGAATLTGPIVRGDVRTVERHLAALEATPELADMYRVAAAAIVTVARAAGRLDADTARTLDSILAR